MSKRLFGTGVGVFGGTFDPVHIGHLRVALELQELLGLSEMRLIPCADPPHRDTPLAAGADRLVMLQRAVANGDCLRVDDREMHRAGPSYSIDTLLEIRRELGAATPLFFCIGMDSLVNLASWHRWRELLQQANIVVSARPGWQQPQQGPVAEWLADCQTEDFQAFRESTCGKVFIVAMTLLPISSTAIREGLKRGASPRFLIPDGVLDYIEEQRLYTSELSSTPPT